MSDEWNSSNATFWKYKSICHSRISSQGQRSGHRLKDSRASCSLYYMELLCVGNLLIVITGPVNRIEGGE